VYGTTFKSELCGEFLNCLRFAKKCRGNAAFSGNILYVIFNIGCELGVLEVRPSYQQIERLFAHEHAPSQGVRPEGGLNLEF
jgi:hypothetical protein